MNPEPDRTLEEEARVGGASSIRNLAAAEAAILRGQFNVAKVLRAVAHAERVQAMQAARRLANQDPAALFRNLLADLESSKDQAGVESARARVRQRMKELLTRARASIETHSDVMESDVAQSLWGCFGCGFIAEGARPEACPVCGALASEFEWFGPFYATTHEHLGQLMPAEIVATLESVPDQLAAILSRADDSLLRRKPSTEEWCVKEIVGHMLETDLLFARRVKTILDAQGMPNLDTPIPPWKLQEGKGYEEMSSSDLSARFRQARSASVGLVRGLGPKEWTRSGSMRGASATLLDLGTWVANHDRGHLAQIRGLCGI